MEWYNTPINSSCGDGLSFLSRNEIFDPHKGTLLGIVATFLPFLPASETGLRK